MTDSTQIEEARRKAKEKFRDETDSKKAVEALLDSMYAMNRHAEAKTYINDLADL